jgi:hypothetical protein
LIRLRGNEFGGCRYAYDGAGKAVTIDAGRLLPSLVIIRTIGIVGIVYGRRRGIAAIRLVIDNEIGGAIPGERYTIRMEVLRAVRPAKGLILRDGKANVSKK